jgi:hypothetical protein
MFIPLLWLIPGCLACSEQLMLNIVLNMMIAETTYAIAEMGPFLTFKSSREIKQGLRLGPFAASWECRSSPKLPLRRSCTTRLCTWPRISMQK